MNMSVNIAPDLSNLPKYLNEFEHFVDCVRNDREPEASAEQAMELIKIIEGVYRSAQVKKEIFNTLL